MAVPIAAVVLLLGLPMPLHAQASASAATLSERLTAIESEIETLQQRRNNARQTWEREQSQLQTQRRELAQQLLEIGLKRERLQQESEQLTRELQQARTERDALQTGLNRLMKRLLNLAERMDLHLSESPDHVTFETVTRDELRALAEGDWNQQVEQAVRTLARFIDLHDRASQMRVTRASIHTADGSLEAVDLLSVGRMAYAYRTVQDGRIGLALASPADATGYRWVESLARDHQRRLTEVFDSPATGASLYRVPMDVTGQVRAEMAMRDSGMRATVFAGGLVMIPLGLVALAALLLIGERFWFLHRAGRGGEGVASEVFEACRRKDYDAAIKRCKASDGVVSRVLLACLSRRQQGQHAMEDSIQEQLLHETPRLERYLAGIAVLGAIAPLLGLLGTVTGIIQTFEVITTFGNVQPGAMAGGISEALITTAAGLIVAIPILLLHSMLSGKADRVISDAEKHAATLLNLSQAHAGASTRKSTAQPQEQGSPA